MKREGLTTKEVLDRQKSGLGNYVDEPKTKTKKEIIDSNVFTYFNILNVVLALMIIISSIFNGELLYGLKNSLFIGVAFVNTIISIIEELYAKKIIDELNVLAESKINVIRNGDMTSVTKEELVMDDLCVYETGNQVVTDCKIVEGKVEVNESFITGESDPIEKGVGDEILSGSFIVSGKCYSNVTHIGKDNYVSKITNEAKYVKETSSIIYTSFEKMIKILSFCLIPIGIIFFINQYFSVGSTIPNSLMSTVSALIGMIPEGLVLLTSSAMAVSVIRLKKYNVLVQELYSIENLARVDVICLDKTGTITTGEMNVNRLIVESGTEDEFKKLLSKYVSALDDNNVTMNTIKNYVDVTEDESTEVLPFSSIRKYSGVSLKTGNYYLGSPENLLEKVPKDITEYQNEYRVLVLTKGNKEFKDINNTKAIGYILIEDQIKKSAKETMEYFKNEGITVKIISGDSDITVSNISKKVGITDIKSIDMSKINDSEIPSIVEEYNIFGRVKPDQKKKIIMALKELGHKVAMTGDGVNDCLALKASDCSIAMSNGSDAAKNVSEFVLLDNSIDNLPKIMKEGRKSINNIERSSSLLLNKTIFTILLILACIFLKSEYFFIPIHLTLITAFTISTPSFLLALEDNNELVKGNFLQKAFLRAFPAALTVVFNVVIIQLFEQEFELPVELCNTLTVFLTASTGFIFLNSICKPYNLVRGVMFGVLLTGFLYCSIFHYSFFNMDYINKDTILVFTVLFICSLFIFDKLKELSKYLLKKTNNV